MRRTTIASSVGAALLGGAMALAANPANAASKPTRNVEFIVPAGIGGGAGQMAQLIQGIVQKHHLMPTSMVVISKKGGSGAEGFLYVKNHKGDPTSSSSRCPTCSRRRWPPVRPSPIRITPRSP